MQETMMPPAIASTSAKPKLLRTISKEKMEDVLLKAPKHKVKIISKSSSSEKTISESSLSGSHERIVGYESKLITSKRIAGKGKDSPVKRSKGGGEEGDKIYQRLARAPVRDTDTPDLEEMSKRSVATQV